MEYSSNDSSVILQFYYSPRANKGFDSDMQLTVDHRCSGISLLTVDRNRDGQPVYIAYHSNIDTSDECMEFHIGYNNKGLPWNILNLIIWCTAIGPVNYQCNELEMNIIIYYFLF